METSVSPESRSSRARALAAVWAWAVRMRASRSSISLSLSPSATVVFGPAKLCLPSSPSVSGGMPRPQFNYFVDIILAGDKGEDQRASARRHVTRRHRRRRERGVVVDLSKALASRQRFSACGDALLDEAAHLPPEVWAGISRPRYGLIWRRAS